MTEILHERRPINDPIISRSEESETLQDVSKLSHITPKTYLEFDEFLCDRVGDTHTFLRRCGSAQFIN